jgi:hypothetical protein
VIRMLWFLPVSLGIGTLLTHEAVLRRREARRNPIARDWWLFLLLGWVPILAWIASQFVEQY